MVPLILRDPQEAEAEHVIERLLGSHKHDTVQIFLSSATHSTLCVTPNNSDCDILMVWILSGPVRCEWLIHYSSENIVLPRISSVII